MNQINDQAEEHDVLLYVLSKNCVSVSFPGKVIEYCRLLMAMNTALIHKQFWTSEVYVQVDITL